MSARASTALACGLLAAAGLLAGLPAAAPAEVLTYYAERRGLFHEDYAGKTLRENLGLARPAAGAWKATPRAAAE